MLYFFLLLVLGITLVQSKPPNFLVIVADDLGYYDTQIFNPNSPTPAIQSLSSNGLALDHHYVFRYHSKSLTP